MQVVERRSPEYRVLVELAAQARPMTTHDLYESIGDLTPEHIHTALLNLGYGLTRYIEATATFPNPGSSRVVWHYTVTWEGHELLRRIDTETTRTMRAVPARKKRWWRR